MAAIHATNTTNIRINFDSNRWRCTKCGRPGRGCDTTINIINIGVHLLLRGREIPSSLLEVSKHPGFCGDCRDHNLLELRKQAVIRGRRKRARVVARDVPEMFQACADRLEPKLKAGHESEGSHVDGERLATQNE